MPGTAVCPRLSLNTATTKRWSLAEAVDGAARFGLTSIGLWRDRVQEVGLDTAARLLRAAGLQVSSLCRGGFLTASDASDIAAALGDNRQAILEAAALGAPELVMVVGGLTTPGGVPSRNGGVVSRDLAGARARVAERIADLVPFAGDHGVRLALEPMHPMFAADRGVLSTLGQALDLASPFPVEAVGVVVDTYHTWWDPELEAQVERAGAQGRLALYQVCDWVIPLAADFLLSRGHVGDGWIDFQAITRWITRAGYQGPVEVEVFNQQIWDQPGERTLSTLIERFHHSVAPWLGNGSGSHNPDRRSTPRKSPE